MAILAASADACAGLNNWSPIAAAPNQSAIAAVLGGFVFAGVVVVLSERRHGRREEASMALKLLFSAFFGLVVVAYLFSDTAGEQICPRAETDEVLAGGILGTFAIVMIVALTWLVVAYERHTGDVLVFLRRLIYFASAFVVLLLCTSSQGYLAALKDSHLVVNVILYVTGPMLFPGLAIWNRLSPQHPLGRGDSPGTANKIVKEWGSAVSRCAWVTLAYLAYASGATGIAISLPPSVWQDGAPGWLAYTAAITSLVFPIIVLAFAVRALARAEGVVPDASEAGNQQAPLVVIDIRYPSVSTRTPLYAGERRNLVHRRSKHSGLSRCVMSYRVA